MRAGKLNRRVTIQRKSITQSDSGEEIITWEDVATVWAGLKFERGSERFAIKQIVGQSVVTFQVRWSRTVSELTSEHQILFDGREFDVQDVREIDRRVGIEIDALVRSELPLREFDFSLDFSNPRNSGYLAILDEFGVSPFAFTFDFSDPNNSGYVPLLED